MARAPSTTASSSIKIVNMRVLVISALAATAAAFAPAQSASALRPATTLNVRAPRPRLNSPPLRDPPSRGPDFPPRLPQAYVPPGFTAAEWAAKQKQEKQAKVDNKKKYPKGAPQVLGVGRYLEELAAAQTFKQDAAKNSKINKTGHRRATRAPTTAPPPSPRGAEGPHRGARPPRTATGPLFRPQVRQGQVRRVHQGGLRRVEGQERQVERRCRTHRPPRTEAESLRPPRATRPGRPPRAGRALFLYLVRAPACLTRRTRGRRTRGGRPRGAAPWGSSGDRVGPLAGSPPRERVPRSRRAPEAQAPEAAIREDDRPGLLPEISSAGSRRGARRSSRRAS